MKTLIQFMLIALLLTNCSSNKELFVYYEKCLNNSINNKYLMRKIDFFKEMNTFEKNLIKKGILKGNSKDDYISTIKKIGNENKDITKKWIVEDDILERGVISIYSGNVLGICPDKIRKTGKGKPQFLFSRYIFVKDKIQEHGYNSKLLIDYIKLLDNDFKKDIYRLPFLYLLNYSIMISFDNVH